MTNPTDADGTEIDADTLAMLTPEELAALNDSDFDEEGDEDEDTGDGDEGGDDDGGEGDDEAELPADPQDGTDPKADELPAGDAAPDPAFPEIDPAELTKANDALKLDMKKAREAFDDGELTGDEYDAKLEEITDKIAENRSAIREAEKAEAAYNTAWVKNVQTFAKDHADLFADQAHVAAYDAEVRAITASSRFDHLSHRQKLDLALSRYAVNAEAEGNPLPAEWLPAKGKALAKPGKRKPLQSELGEIPRTLARAPAAQLPADSDSRFGQLQAMIDNGELDALGIEAALNKMTPAEREAFASADV